MFQINNMANVLAKYLICFSLLLVQLKLFSLFLITQEVETNKSKVNGETSTEGSMTTKFFYFELLLLFFLKTQQLLLLRPCFGAQRLYEMVLILLL